MHITRACMHGEACFPRERITIDLAYSEGLIRFYTTRKGNRQSITMPSYNYCDAKNKRPSRLFPNSSLHVIDPW
jgi:ribosomal protein L33